MELLPLLLLELEEVLVPVRGVLLFELFTRPLELLLPVRPFVLLFVPLGRLLLFGRFTLLLLPLEGRDVPLLLPLLFGRLTLPLSLPVRPLFGRFTLLLEPPLLDAGGLLLPLLPELMLPPSAFGLTVALGAGSAGLGAGGVLFHSLWVAG